MAGPIIGGLAKGAAVQGEKSKAAEKPSQAADAKDVDRFKQSLQQGGNESLKSNGANLKSAQQQVADVQQPAKADSMGDAILNKIQDISGDFKSSAAGVENELDKPNLSESDLIKAQLEVSQVSVEREVTAETTNKTTKGIQALLQDQ